METILFNADILGTNNYLCYDQNTKEAVLIDCSCDVYQVKQKLDELGLALSYILLTHGHFDHVISLMDAKKLFPEVKICISKNDKVFLDNIDKQTEYFGIDSFELPNITDFIDENSELYFAGEKIQIIETPGHSAGSLVFKISDTLFTGDTIFREEIGRCDLPTGDFSKIRNSIVNKLFTLDETLKIFPGHGAPSTLAYEKVHNLYFGSCAREF